MEEEKQEEETITTEEPSPSEGTPDVEEPEEDATEPEEAKNTEEPEEPVRFDQHPRFRQLIQQKNELQKRLELREQKLREYEEVLSKFADKDPADLVIDDPKAYAEYLSATNLKTGLEQETELLKQEYAELEEQRVMSDIESFAAENPDFDSKWEAGEIQKYMESHPAVGAVGAYLAISMENRLAKAREEAAKAERERILKNQRAKKEAVTLSSGASAPPDTDAVPPELKEPKKYGGAISVLAKRMEERLRGKEI